MEKQSIGNMLELISEFSKTAISHRVISKRIFLRRAILTKLCYTPHKKWPQNPTRQGYIFEGFFLYTYQIKFKNHYSSEYCCHFF